MNQKCKEKCKREATKADFWRLNAIRNAISHLASHLSPQNAIRNASSARATRRSSVDRDSPVTHAHYLPWNAIRNATLAFAAHFRREIECQTRAPRNL